MRAYKLLRKRRDGTLGPLFIHKKQVIPLGVWLQAEDHPTPGFAHRPGWHCARSPEAPHLSLKGRVWCAVEVEDFRTFERPICQGGVWLLANRMKVLEEINAESTTESIHAPVEQRAFDLRA